MRRAGAHGLVSHGAGFLASGLISLAVDMGVTSILHRGFDMPPLIARLCAICVAIVVAWQCHRRLTFNIKAAPTLSEFLKFTAVAWTSVASNYSAFAAALYLVPEIAPEIALILACFVSMIVTYVGMRYGAFRGAGGFTR